MPNVITHKILYKRWLCMPSCQDNLLKKPNQLNPYTPPHRLIQMFHTKSKVEISQTNRRQMAGQLKKKRGERSQIVQNSNSASFLLQTSRPTKPFQCYIQEMKNLNTTQLSINLRSQICAPFFSPKNSAFPIKQRKVNPNQAPVFASQCEIEQKLINYKYIHKSQNHPKLN